MQHIRTIRTIIKTSLDAIYLLYTSVSCSPNHLQVNPFFRVPFTTLRNNHGSTRTASTAIPGL